MTLIRYAYQADVARATPLPDARRSECSGAYAIRAGVHVALERNVEEAHSMLGSRGTIVIADDDPDVRDVLACRFGAAGYDVVTASDGAEMIELLQHVEQPVAIFVDLLMPGIIGTSVIDFICSEPRFADVPLAVVTGSPELAPTAVTVFTKPAHFDALLGFVKDHAAVVHGEGDRPCSDVPP